MSMRSIKKGDGLEPLGRSSEEVAIDKLDNQLDKLEEQFDELEARVEYIEGKLSRCGIWLHLLSHVGDFDLEIEEDEDEEEEPEDEDEDEIDENDAISILKVHRRTLREKGLGNESLYDALTLAIDALEEDY